MIIYIKGNNNTLADEISILKTLDIYKEPLDNPKTSDTMTYIAEMVSSNIQTSGIDKLHAKNGHPLQGI